MAINYPRSHWGPAAEGRQQRLQPRTGARNRRLILVNSLTGRWARWACGTGWLLLQQGSLLALYPSFPSVLLSVQLFLCLFHLLPSPASSSYPCFHPFLPPAPPALHSEVAPWRCSHPQSWDEAGPCLLHSDPSRCPRARSMALGLGHPVPQPQGPTFWLSREKDKTMTNHKATLRAQTPLPQPSPRGHGQSAAQPGQPSNAEKGRDILEASKCRFSHSRWQIPQQGGEEGCPLAPPAIALTLHLPFQGWEPAPGSQALPSTTLFPPAPEVPKDTQHNQGPPSDSYPQPSASRSISHCSKRNHKAAAKKGP